MSPCRTYVIQYTRNADAVNEPKDHLPRRWEICVQTKKRTPTDSKSRGTTFAIEGTVGGSWAYRCDANREYGSSAAWAGSVYLGEVDDSKIARIDEVLRTVNIKHGNKYWHSQQWVWEGLLQLRQAGILLRLPETFGELTTKMEDAKDAQWQVGEDSD